MDEDEDVDMAAEMTVMPRMDATPQRRRRLAERLAEGNLSDEFREAAMLELVSTAPRELIAPLLALRAEKSLLMALYRELDDGDYRDYVAAELESVRAEIANVEGKMLDP